MKKMWFGRMKKVKYIRSITFMISVIVLSTLFLMISQECILADNTIHRHVLSREEIEESEKKLEPYVTEIADSSEYIWEEICPEQINLNIKYDPRCEGKVSSIKDQGGSSLCWDYSVIAQIESYLIGQEQYDNTINLSETHLAYVLWKKYQETKKISFEQYCMEGETLAATYLALVEKRGPVIEERFPSFVSNDLYIPKEYEMAYDFEIDKIYGLKLDGSQETIQNAKRIISRLGGIAVSYYSNSSYYEDMINEEGDTSYYFPTSISMSNHAVEIIGWDDDFSKENFKKTPEDDGAWLVKNSWGERGYSNVEEGSGYYWISYYDASIGSFKAYAASYHLPEECKDISVSSNSIVLNVGESVSVNAVFSPIQVSDQRRCLQSSDEAIVMTKESGEIVAVKKGMADVTVFNMLNTNIRTDIHVTVLSDTQDIADKQDNVDKQEITNIVAGNNSTENHVSENIEKTINNAVDNTVNNVVNKQQPYRKKQKIIVPKTSFSFKANKLKRKKITFKIEASSKTKITYSIVKYPSKAKKYLTVTKKGYVTLKKGAKKGKYIIKLIAKENTRYYSASKTIIIRIK